MSTALPMVSSRVELTTCGRQWGMKPLSVRPLMGRPADSEEAQGLLAVGEHAQGLFADGEHALTLLADGPVELAGGVLSWLESLSSVSPYG